MKPIRDYYSGYLEKAIKQVMEEVDSIVDIVVRDERERCAKIADSLNSTQDIGDRIRKGTPDGL